ncbi:oocyte zinc finger protein XlCOF6-like isoform X3 [Manduca sexta]|uniref:oocyte zinc finger protein XlCOF6-like isoform X3 n=1 Tax=Manduca sexta TaxID=7130 RepID=UPI00188FA48C|nr:oocyte zinc finger protein XlCOF6-like isoform X3 [Manduca sexta]
MCDIKGNNTNKYDILCHVCLSSNRKLSVLGEFDGLFRKICNYPLETPNIYLCWECIAMLKKMQIFQAKVVEAQRLLRLHCAEIQTSGPYFCDICSSRFKTKQSILHHVKKHRVALECIACEFKCSSPDVMKVHLRSHKSAVQCLTCDLTLQDIKTFRMHYKATHASFVCDHCGKRCFSKHTLEKHMRHTHNFDNFECKDCKKRFKNSRSLGKHARMQHVAPTSTELAYCVPCDKQFTTRGLYYQHLSRSSKHAAERTVNSSKPKVQCPECSNVYSRKVYMMNHYRHVHVKRTNYYCSICDKYFLNNTRYKGHMRSNHEGGTKVKNKLCTVCGKGFTENRILIHHMRTHSGERPYECSHCSSRFAQKYAMQKHEKTIHGGKKS